MKKIGLVGAGSIAFNLDKNLPYIGVDGGVQVLLDQGIMPSMVVGDFDSLKNKEIIEQIESIQLPMRKDDTDTAVAIEYLIEKGYNDIVLYGVTGGRIDHFMAVLCLLKKYRDYRLTIINDQNKIYLLKAGTHHIHRDQYQYISFFAVSQTVITIEGCQYPLNEYLLKQDDPLCVSNEMINDQCTILISDDVLVIQSNNKGGK